jgi:sporulation protein YlmC with PRC-barrel domain
MLRTFSDLARYTIGATDGDLGSVRDVYFDDGTWTVRYLVVDTGDWLPGRRILVSPISIRSPDPDRRTLRVALTMMEVKSSPDVNTARPVSRQHEIELSRHYGYPYYWVGPYRWGAASYPRPLPESPPQSGPVDQEIPARSRQSGDQHLQNATALMGHAIRTEEGEIGRVEDVLVDDKAWAIRYMVVDTKNWWPGKKVFVSPEWLTQATWDESATLSCIVVAVAGGTSSGRTAILSPEHRPTVPPRSAAASATQYRC